MLQETFREWSEIVPQFQLVHSKNNHKSIMNRHLSRTIALQTLFELDFTGRELDDAGSVIERNSLEFAPGMGDFSFIENLVRGVVEKKSDLDLIIEKAAPDWPISKIAVVDRNILRLGLYELLFADRGEVPPKVAINEAIEIAKTFGGENSYKFVNGVLGAVYKQMGEPQKDDISGKKKRDKDVDNKDLPVEELGGAVVYAKDGDDLYMAMVHDIFGHWTLSKGKLEKDEELLEGIKRGVKEELGLEIELEDRLGSNEYIASDPEKGRIRKQVAYYVARAPFEELKLGTSGGLDDAKWFKLADIVELNIYDDILPILTKAVNVLLKK
jgi:N utilization substance protein B